MGNRTFVSLLLAAVCATASAQTADLSVTMSPPYQKAHVDEVVPEDVTIVNHGPDTAWNVALHASTPYTATIDGISSAYSGINCQHMGGDADCTIVWIPAGGRVTVTLEARAISSSGDVANWPFGARVTSAAHDPDLTNNEDGAWLSTWYPLSIRFSPHEKTVALGDVVHYDVIVENGASADLGHFHLEHVPPAGFVKVATAWKAIPGKPGVLGADFDLGPNSTYTIPMTAVATISGALTSTVEFSSLSGFFVIRDETAFTVLPPPRHRVVKH